MIEVYLRVENYVYWKCISYLEVQFRFLTHRFIFFHMVIFLFLPEGVMMFIFKDVFFIESFS